MQILTLQEAIEIACGSIWPSVLFCLGQIVRPLRVNYALGQLYEYKLCSLYFFFKLWLLFFMFLKKTHFVASGNN